MAQVAWYPLRFEPIYKEKVWGGRALERLGRDLPGGPEKLIGESWELADLGQTSVSGGGGGAARSVVANGPLAGATLHALMHEHGRAVMGDLAPNEAGEFPLLLKFLDARQNLSVQVHPSPEYAARHADAYLKSEAWYIVDAEPGAAIYKGVQPGTTAEAFREAIARDAVEPLLIRVPVKPGDCHYLPSGTVHALGAGVVVAEVQTPSDTTFRVYDWGRTERELHIEQALACIHFGPADTSGYERFTHVAGEATSITHLVQSEYFRIDRVTADAGHAQPLAFDQPTIWMVLEGSATATGDAGEPVGVGTLDTLYMPPAMRDGRMRFDEPTTWLEITFPQAQRNQLA